MAMIRSRCVDPHVRLDSVIDAVEEGAASTTVTFQEEGVTVLVSNTLNVVSAIATITDVGGVATLTITGTAGSQNLFETIDVAGQTPIVADSTTDTLTLAEGDNIAITTDHTTDTVTFAVVNVFSFKTIHVSGQSDVVAESVDDTLNLVAGTGIVILTSAGSDSVEIGLDATLLNAIDPGDGIVFTSTKIEVDLANSDPCLEFDGTGPPADLRLKVKSDGGLERTSDGVQDKWRYHYVKGQATSAQTPGNPFVDNLTILHGEDPGGTLDTSGSFLDLYCADNEVIYAKFDNGGNAGLDALESWTTDTMANIRPILAGLADYAPASTMLLGHLANATDGGQQKVQWKTVDDWLKTISGYSGSGTLYLRVVNGTMGWVTKGSC